MEQATLTSKTARPRSALRGESMIASLGAAVAVLLVVSVGASTIWVMRSQSAAVDVAATRQARSTGELLSKHVETLLNDADIAGVRRVLAEAQSQGLTQYRVTLSDGSVVASSETSEITARVLPDSWQRVRAIDDAVTQPADGTLALKYPIEVAGRGGADLDLVASLASSGPSTSEMLGGVGAVTGLAMAGLFAIYRTVRRYVRTTGAIRDALLSLRNGENSAIALRVSEQSADPEAVTWNQLMGERERLRHVGVADRAREVLGGRAGGKGDLSAACDAMSQGLLLIDDQNRVSYANGAAAAFLLCKREELVGSEIGKFLQVEPVVEAVRGITAGEGRRRTVHDIERKDEGDGAGVLRFNVRPVRKDDSAAAMLTIEDITQQKVAEAARHSFVAQATHELRTPLTNIRLYVETAIEDGENDPATRSRCLNVINGETRRLERIVSEMLSVAEIEAGSFKMNRDDVRLETVFEDLQADYTPQAKDKDIELTFNLPPKLPLIKGDRDKILMALHNLVGNALKYTPAGGKVALNVNSAGKNLLVEVQDSGIGISEEDAAKIFERFYRAKDPRVGKITGTGLGLSIAREVVRLHGGDIGVDSQINQGSTFTVTLPVISEAA